MKKGIIAILICMLFVTSSLLTSAGFLRNDKNSDNTNHLINEKESKFQREKLDVLDDLDWDYTSNPPHMYSIPSGNVGIGTLNPSAKLDIDVSNGGAVAIGSGTTVALGNYSIALGFAAKAIADYSIAMGKYTNASGVTSTALGWGTSAKGSCSIAMGEGTTAGGSFSTAMGRSIKVNGNYSVGIGLSSKPYYVDPDNVMSIMGGYVGIGTTAPNYTLEVSGDDDIVAQFSGRVKGVDAIYDDEFVTKGQVKTSKPSCFTPYGTSDPSGIVGDISWDSNYFYLKTSEGWKRAKLETWDSSKITLSNNS
jgi:hypothetical protein